MVSVSSELVIPSEHPCFADHFPDDALLPGAVLLKWILDKVISHNPDLVLTEITSAKFLQAVRPGMSCSLIIKNNPDKNIVLVSCLHGESLVCKCSIKHQGT